MSQNYLELLHRRGSGDTATSSVTSSSSDVNSALSDDKEERTKYFDMSSGGSSKASFDLQYQMPQVSAAARESDCGCADLAEGGKGGYENMRVLHVCGMNVGGSDNDGPCTMETIA
jgi:hypothetical protein